MCFISFIQDNTVATRLHEKHRTIHQEIGGQFRMYDRWHYQVPIHNACHDTPVLIEPGSQQTPPSSWRNPLCKVLYSCDNSMHPKLETSYLCRSGYFYTLTLGYPHPYQMRMQMNFTFVQKQQFYVGIGFHGLSFAFSKSSRTSAKLSLLRL